MTSKRVRTQTLTPDLSFKRDPPTIYIGAVVGATAGLPQIVAVGLGYLRQLPKGADGEHAAVRGDHHDRPVLLFLLLRFPGGGLLLLLFHLPSFSFFFARASRPLRISLGSLLPKFSSVFGYARRSGYPKPWMYFAQRRQ